MDEPEQGNEHRLFNLTEAERARREVEPLLVQAMEIRRIMGELDDKLSSVSTRIMMMGGVTVDYEAVARVRRDHNLSIARIKDALDKIQATGCVVKDLDTGLVDFPTIINDEEVFLCWRLGEDRIRFWHRMDEGFSSRKPISPRDTGPQHPIQ
jgi:hypothetical protein